MHEFVKPSLRAASGVLQYSYRTAPGTPQMRSTARARPARQEEPGFPLVQRVLTVPRLAEALLAAAGAAAGAITAAVLTVPRPEGALFAVASKAAGAITTAGRPMSSLKRNW